MENEVIEKAVDAVAETAGEALAEPVAEAVANNVGNEMVAVTATVVSEPVKKGVVKTVLDFGANHSMELLLGGAAVIGGVVAIKTYTKKHPDGKLAKMANTIRHPFAALKGKKEKVTEEVKAEKPVEEAKPNA